MIWENGRDHLLSCFTVFPATPKRVSILTKENLLARSSPHILSGSKIL
jgi:hypothetical protein